MWVARDESDGTVRLFDKKPKKIDGYFYDNLEGLEYIYLGKHPKLGFKLKRGESQKVNLKFEKAV